MLLRYLWRQLDVYKRQGKSVSFDENGNIVVSVYENGEKISEFLVDAEV